MENGQAAAELPQHLCGMRRWREIPHALQSGSPREPQPQTDHLRPAIPQLTPQASPVNEMEVLAVSP